MMRGILIPDYCCCCCCCCCFGFRCVFNDLHIYIYIYDEYQHAFKTKNTVLIVLIWWNGIMWFEHGYIYIYYFIYTYWYILWVCSLPRWGPGTTGSMTRGDGTIGETANPSPRRARATWRSNGGWLWTCLDGEVVKVNQKNDGERLNI
jgi:hypothetical protein